MLRVKENHENIGKNHEEILITESVEFFSSGTGPLSSFD